MQKFLSQLEQKEESGTEPSKASILKSLKKMSERKKCQELRKLASEMGGESKKAREKFNRWALTLLDEAQRPKFERAIKNQRSTDRKMKKLKLMSRPLAEAPLSTRERKLVEGLLSLLMRTSESIAR